MGCDAALRSAHVGAATEFAAAVPPPPGSYETPFAYQQLLAQQPPTQRSTNRFAVASLVLGILGDPLLLSVIFGIIALAQIKNRAQAGRGMAIAGLVLSGLWAVVIGVAITMAALSPTQVTNARDVKVGDCFADLPTGNRVSSVDTTSCDRPHSGEVVAVLTMPDGAFPDTSMFDDYKQKCRDSLASYSSTAMQDPNVDLAVMPPSQDSWQQGDRAMVCIATFSSQRSGSIKG